MEQQRNLLLLLVEQFRLKEDICELKVDLKKAEKNLKSRKELEQQIHTLQR